MQVFVSDLHLTDEDHLGTVSDVQLASFIERLVQSHSERSKPIHLVFLGDILELLRSTLWDDLWTKHQSAPWSGMGPGFLNFADGHAEHCALSVATGIVHRYPRFQSTLQGLVDAGLIETHYIPGNHDFMVQLSPKLREIVVNLLSLRNYDPQKRFPETYRDRAASLLAVHGHSYDAINWHRETEGYWRWAMPLSFGLSIALRVSHARLWALLRPRIWAG